MSTFPIYVDAAMTAASNAIEITRSIQEQMLKKAVSKRLERINFWRRLFRLRPRTFTEIAEKLMAKPPKKAPWRVYGHETIRQAIQLAWACSASMQPVVILSKEDAAFVRLYTKSDQNVTVH